MTALVPLYSGDFSSNLALAPMTCGSPDGIPEKSISIGGKPVGSIPPYVVIMFEMTILFGALTTILGIAFNALFAARRQGTIAYDPRFSNDKFGIFVPCGPERAGAVEQLLRGSGAEEVRRA